MGTTFDLDGDFLEERFGKDNIHNHDLPRDTETEIKFLHQQDIFFAPLYQALLRHPDVYFCPKGMQGKDNVLVNLGLDTYDPKDPSKTLLFHRNGFQARLRFGLNIKSEVPVISDIDLNIKSILDNRPAYRLKNPLGRKEFEQEGSSLREAWQRMKQDEGAAADTVLNFADIDPSTVFVQGVAMSSRVHGEFAHFINYINRTRQPDWMLKYLVCNDHTLHVDNYAAHMVAEDFESEDEARKIITSTPQTVGDATKVAIVEASYNELQSYQAALSDKLWEAHRSKLGRTYKAIARSCGYKGRGGEEMSMIAALQNGISVDTFLGKEKPLQFQGYDFIDSLTRIARRHLLTGNDLIQDYIHPERFTNPLAVEEFPLHP
jgi:hypothetical protein